MKCKPWVVVLILTTTAGSVSRATAAESIPPPLQPLEIALGKWEYRGQSLPTAEQKAGTWTWSQECGWSANRAFLACSFIMHWPGKVVKSLSVSTYNQVDKGYWHYEVFDSDGSGADPFISRMTVEGNKWTNYGHADGKAYRVVYQYASRSQVSIRIELSTDEVHWTTVSQGEGTKES